jgi:hypothetical protein
MLAKQTGIKKHETFVEGLMNILVEQQAINKTEAAAIVQSFYDSDAYEFDAFLIDEGLVSVAKMLNALEAYYKVPAFDVVGYFFDAHSVHKFPKELMIRYGFIPVEDDETIMIVAAADPADSDLLMEIGKYVSYDIQFRVGLYQDIVDAVKEFYDPALTEGVAQDIYDLPDTRMANESEFQDEESDDFFVPEIDDEDEDITDFS